MTDMENEFCPNKSLANLKAESEEEFFRMYDCKYIFILP